MAYFFFIVSMTSHSSYVYFCCIFLYSFMHTFEFIVTWNFVHFICLGITKKKYDMSSIFRKKCQQRKMIFFYFKQILITRSSISRCLVFSFSLNRSVLKVYAEYIFLHMILFPFFFFHLKHLSTDIRWDSFCALNLKSEKKRMHHVYWHDRWCIISTKKIQSAFMHTIPHILCSQLFKIFSVYLQWMLAMIKNAAVLETFHSYLRRIFVEIPIFSFSCLAFFCECECVCCMLQAFILWSFCCHVALHIIPSFKCIEISTE